jgi:hypothetical protein
MPTIEEHEKRLEKLIRIGDGWLDGEGIAPTELAVKQASMLSDAIAKFNIKDLYLYPELSGGFVAEIEVGDYFDVNIEISKLGEVSIFYCANFDSPEGLESSSVAAEDIMPFLKKLIGTKE